MAQFAVMHTTKMGSGSGGIGSHIDRTQKNLPKNVDSSRTHLNKEYVATGGTLVQDIERRIDNGYNHRKKDGSMRSIRKDAVKAVGVILSGSHDQMKKIEEADMLDEWAHTNLQFMSSKIGTQNIVRFTMHMDEKTPHIHCVYVPLDKEGRLNAKEIVGDKKKLSETQTEYAQVMERFGLKRGLKNTRTKHMTTREYYAKIENAAAEATIEKNILGAPKSGEEERVQDMARQMEHQLIEAYTRVNKVINADKKRKKLHDENEEKLRQYHKQLENKHRSLDHRENNLENDIKKEVSLALESERGRTEKIKNDTFKETYEAAVNKINTILGKEGLNQRFKLNWEAGTIEVYDPTKQQKIIDQEENKKRGRGYSPGL